MLFRHAIAMAAVAMVASSAHVATAAPSPITYTINVPASSGGITGFITTDGTLGVLDAGANFVDFGLLADNGSLTYLFSPAAGSLYSGYGLSLSATATGLFFNFSEPGQSQLYIRTSPFDFLSRGVCFSSANVSCGNIPIPGFGLYFDTDTVGTSASGVVQIGTAAVPEPASWAMLIAGFGLIGATLRRRRAAMA